MEVPPPSTPSRGVHRDALGGIAKTGDAQAVAGSVATLRQALDRDPGNALLWNDLAALLLVHGHDRGSAFDWIEALEAADRALKLSPGRPEAAFNRALALETVGLFESARVAWLDIADRGAGTPWATEARRHVVSCSKPSRRERFGGLVPRIEGASRSGDLTTVVRLARPFPAEMHLHTRDRMLRRWAEAAVAGDPRAGELLGAARTAAAAVAELTQDRLLEDALSLPGLDAGDGVGVAKAHLDHAEAFEAAEGGGWDCAESLPKLQRSRRSFHLAGSPFAGWTEFFEGICLQRRSGEVGRRALEGLAERVPKERYPMLAGRTRWVLGIVEGRSQRFDAAFAHYDEARTLLRRAWGDGGLASLDFLEGESHGLVGHREAEWRSRRRSLVGLALAGDRRRLHSALVTGALSLQQDGRSTAALAVLDEAVVNASAWGDVYGRTSAHFRRGAVRSALGLEGAIDDFRLARRGSEGLTDGDFRELVLADLTLAEAEGRLADDPLGAAEALRGVCDRYFELGDEVHLARALGLRGEALGRGGQPEAGVEALTSATELALEVLAARKQEAEPRFVVRAERAFRELVSLHLRLGNPRLALEASEQSRRLPPLGLGRTPVDETVDRLAAEGVVALVFQDLAASTVAFHIEGGGVRAIELEKEPQALGALARGATEAIQGGPQEAPARLDALFAALRLADALDADAGGRLVIVPDRSVRAVPWAALRDPATGLHLAQRWAVALSPTLDLASTEKTFSTDSILALGDPELDGARGPLPSLTGARIEARRLSEAYPASTLLVRGEATRDRFLGEWTEHPVVHVAAHSTVDPLAPHRSLLHLGGADLGSWDLPEGDSGVNRLVVLSSCSSSLSGSSVERAPVGLGGLFLSAGTPTVIATLWPVDDYRTLQFAELLHRALLSGVPPADAVRRAQTAMLASGDPNLAAPESWAGFQVFGAGWPAVSMLE
ncbi:MAG: CHAT domain-containing protein [Acidobacteriota bacterium]